MRATDDDLYSLPGGHRMSREPAGLEHIAEKCPKCQAATDEDLSALERRLDNYFADEGAAFSSESTEHQALLYLVTACRALIARTRTAEAEREEAKNELRAVDIAATGEGMLFAEKFTKRCSIVLGLRTQRDALQREVERFRLDVAAYLRAAIRTCDTADGPVAAVDCMADAIGRGDALTTSASGPARREP